MGQVSSFDMAQTMTVRSPYDDSVIGEIPAQTEADVAAAVPAGVALPAVGVPLADEQAASTAAEELTASISAISANAWEAARVASMSL